MLSGASQKVYILTCSIKFVKLLFQAALLNHYHIGEGMNSVHKCSLIPGGSELIVYTTLSGGIGMLVPFSSKEVTIIQYMHSFAYILFH